MAAEQQPQRLYATQEAQLAELLSQIPIPIARVLELAEDVELQALSARPEDLTRDLQSVVPFLAVEFLSYYAEGDENNARFLWKRLPSRLKSVEELKALWAVGQGLYLRNYPQLHRAFDAASEVATDKVYAGLLQVAHQNVRARLVELIARAYENISIDDAGAYLGLDAVQLSTKCQELGWELRDSFIYPIRETRTQQQQDDLLKNVESLVQHEVFLELV